MIISGEREGISYSIDDQYMMGGLSVFIGDDIEPISFCIPTIEKAMEIAFKYIDEYQKNLIFGTSKVRQNVGAKINSIFNTYKDKKSLFEIKEDLKNLGVEIK